MANKEDYYLEYQAMHYMFNENISPHETVDILVSYHNCNWETARNIVDSVANGIHDGQE